MAAADRVLPEREFVAKNEGLQRAAGDNKLVFLVAGGRTTEGSDSFEAQSVPPNHTVLKLMNIGWSVASMIPSTVP